MVITPTTLKITQLLGSRNEQYVIPAYQRRYSWKTQQIGALWDDIDMIGGTDTHLLGTIVCLTGHHNAGLDRLELVDGQQRLTTISIVLHCILERFQKEGLEEAAKDLGRLLTAKSMVGKPQSKIALDSLDSNQFDGHVEGTENDETANPRLAKAFESIRGWIAKRNINDVGEFLYKLQNQAIVIRLDVNDAKNAFKLFETINNRGLRLSPMDIIKNFVLGSAARFGEPELENARTQWMKLIEFLDGLCPETFLRHYMGAQLRSRVTQSMVVDEFKEDFFTRVQEAQTLPDRNWYASENDDEEEDDDTEVDTDISDGNEIEIDGSLSVPRISFREFIGAIVNSARIYRELHKGDTGTPSIDRRLRNLALIKAVQSYGFLMSLRVRGCNDKNFEKVLKMTEALILRRHICKDRSNETEQLFGKLCGLNPDSPLQELSIQFREFSPPDERFKEDFANTRFNGRLADRARYCLEQFEMMEQGKHVEMLIAPSSDVHLEHIIPKQILSRSAKDEVGDWPKYLGENVAARHRRNLWRIGNLTLVAGSLNIGASNHPYKRKKSAYAESALKITNTLENNYPEFRFAQVDQRSEQLADQAIKIWPIP